MNEEQRLNYLRQMGYQAYYPRFVLPGAKTSPNYQLPAQAESAASEQQAATSKAAAKLQEAGQNRPVIEIPAKRAKPATRVEENQIAPEAAQEGAEAKASQSAADQLRFNLQYYSINPQLAVISETPHQLRGKQSRDSTGLLTAILRALAPGFGESDPELRGEAFNWPLAEGIGNEDPRRAAALALQGFINQRQAQDGFANLLIFTTQLPQILTGNDDEELAGDKQLDNLQCQVTFTHSLHSMLAHSMLKRDCWSHLQALRKRLQS
ncbi:MAG: hypothetical protein MI746_07570 [Pseudomonadales bacterium]|nr:hypothetical protein [Pseudomonadales bacterium]